MGLWKREANSGTNCRVDEIGQAGPMLFLQIFILSPLCFFKQHAEAEKCHTSYSKKTLLVI